MPSTLEFVGLCVATAWACEFAARRGPRHALLATTYGRKALRLIANPRVDDERKEKMVPAYAIRMADASVRLAGVLVFGFMPFFAMPWALDMSFSALLSVMLEPKIAVALSCVAALYVFARSRIA